MGENVAIAIDANQVWDVAEAIAWIRELAPVRPAWIEEPTSPDDILGHATIRRAIAPIGVATGEHAANRVMFKQLMQAGAIDAVRFKCDVLWAQLEAIDPAVAGQNRRSHRRRCPHQLPVCHQILTG